MDWNDIIKHSLTILFSVSTIVAAAIYIAKKIISKSLDLALESYKVKLQKEIETHKFELQRDSDRFKFELEKFQTEHQIRYSKLYEERGQVIKLIYNSLINLEKSLLSLTTMFQGAEWITDTEREEDARKKLNNLKNELEINRIYFSDKLCTDIENIYDQSWKIMVEMHMAKLREQSNKFKIELKQYVLPDDLIQPLKTWQEQDEKVRSDIKSARLQLVEQFRSLIGVE